jgi:hypothetical protein
MARSIKAVERYLVQPLIEPLETPYVYWAAEWPSMAIFRELGSSALLALPVMRPRGSLTRLKPGALSFFHRFDWTREDSRWLDALQRPVAFEKRQK